MTEQRLKQLKTLTTRGGVCITLCGIVLNLASGGSWYASGLSLSGVLITFCGHWISSALDKQRADARAADEQHISWLEERIEATENIIGEAGGSLRRVIKKQADEDFMRGFNGDDWK